MFWNGDRWVDERPLNGQGAPAVPGPRRRPPVWLVALPIVVFVPALLVSLWPVNAAGPRLTVGGNAFPGASVTVVGHGFNATTWIQLQWDGSAAGMPTALTASQGTFRTSLEIPTNAAPGPHVVGAGAFSWSGRGAISAVTTAALASATVMVLDPAAAATPIMTAAPTPTPVVTAPTPTPVVTALTPAPTAAASVLPSRTPPPTSTPTSTPTAPVLRSPTPYPTSMPVPTVGPSAGPKVVELTSSVTAAQFVSAVQDNTTDVIELAGGIYRPGIIRLNVDRTRPLLIRPTPGATVVFAGGSRPAFYIGLGGVAGRITIEGLVFDGFSMGPDGIIWLGNCHDITVNNMVVRNSTGQPGYSWALYLSTDGGAGPRNVVANDWIVDGGARTLGGLQIGHTPAARGVTANGWHVSNASYAIYSSTTATGVRISDWRIDSSGLTTFANLSVVLANTQGTISNVHATNSGGAEIESPMVDGGGNTWG